MNVSTKNRGMRAAAISSILAVLFSLSAHASLYTYPNNFSDSGAIPQGGTTFSVEHTISGIRSPITSVEFVLTLNDNVNLTGNSSGIQGTLILNPSGSDTYVSFSPVATSSGTGSQNIYDVTFSGFNGSNPNNTWALNLWDNSTSGVENGSVSWSLNITADVPEPIDVALGIFAGLAILWWCLGSCWKKTEVRPHELETEKSNV